MLTPDESGDQHLNAIARQIGADGGARRVGCRHDLLVRGIESGEVVLDVVEEDLDLDEVAHDDLADFLDALDAASTSLTVSTNEGGNNTNMNSAKARKAKALMDTKGVPRRDRFMVIHADGLNSGMLADTTATSSDYNAVKALVEATKSADTPSAASNVCPKQPRKTPAMA